MGYKQFLKLLNLDTGFQNEYKNILGVHCTVS